MGLLRDGALALRIPNRNVGVGPHRDGALLRIDVEDLGRVGRGDEEPAALERDPRVEVRGEAGLCEGAGSGAHRAKDADGLLLR